MEKDQTTQAMNALAEFAKLLFQEYPLVFVGESGTMKIKYSKQYFPYKVSLTIKKRKYTRKKTGL